MATIYRERKSPFWYARFRVWDGERREWKLTGKSTKALDRATALAVANQYEAAALAVASAAGAVDRGAAMSPEFAQALVDSLLTTAGLPPASRERTRVGDFVRETWLPEKDNPQTRKDYEAVWNRLEGWAKGRGKPVRFFDDVTPAAATEWRDWLTRQGLSRGRVNYHLAVAGGLWLAAVRIGLAAKNPFAAVKRLATTGAEDNRAARVFSADQVEALVRACQSLDDTAKASEWALVIRVAAICGLRLRDVTRLRGRSIDAETGDLDYLPEKTRKSSGGKRVLFPVDVLDPDLAKELREKRAGLDPDEWVTPTLAGQPVAGGAGLSRVFSRLMAEAGIDVEEEAGRGKLGRTRRSHGFHSFRHTAITRAKERGIPPELRRALFGHSSADIHARYTHHDSESLRREVANAVRPKE